MKRLSTLLLSAGLPMIAMAQGWPANYDGVMLQGFYWDSFADSKWKNIEAQADELSAYFDLVWVPQSGKASASKSMGYDVLYYWNQNSSFGTEEQLRSMIGALKERGTGVVADVVVNHRATLGSWTDFPAETYKGETYQMFSTDICANDDGGKTAQQNPGIALSPNNDEGEGWDGMRDLDHQSENVQRCVSAYTQYLKEDLGYTGFRYDMVKGFHGKHVADYNRQAGIQYSVGEYWDGNASVVKKWIDQTKYNDIPQSAAFDFPFRYTCRDVVRDNDWSKLKNASLMSDANYRQYSVTFIENHDTEYRSSSEPQDPIRRDTLALNAWMLSMPGTPCVFLKHWQSYKSEIKNMIEVRRLAGISNLSTYNEFASNKLYCVRKVNGANATLTVAVGDYTGNLGSGMQEIVSGKNYRLALSQSLNTVWIDVPSGTFAENASIKTALTAISADASAQIIYTTDGTTPSATHGTKVASGTVIEVMAGTTLCAALLVDGKVVNPQQRTYYVEQPEEEEPFDPFTMQIYVRSEVAQFNSRMNYYIWAGENDTQLNGNWPGKQISEKATVDGQEWFVQPVEITKASMLPVNIVLNTGSGSPQTVDVTGLTAHKVFLVIESTKQGSKYMVSDVTSQHSTDITDIFAPEQNTLEIYDLLGRKVTHMQPGQLYMIGGKKVIK
ncbi:MAG: alpha-amylase family glycosyl hydrolase [Bacteroidales bacterium]|nr:alpha-amylase family glycosyl hydrolase [Bacteroidales bacterium]